MPQFQILNKQPSFKETLGELLGSGTGEGIGQALEQFNQNKALEKEQSKYEKAGYPEDIARLMATASTGGQTAITKELLESIKRGGGDEPGRTPKEEVAHQEKAAQRAFERNKKYLDRVSNIANEAPKEKLAISQMRGALNEGDFNSYRNGIADLLGLDILKSASAQMVNSASKQFLMSSLSDLTGRPNQFIEQQITKALISPQYKDAANELILIGMEGLANLKEREAEIALQIEEDYAARGQEVPRNFQKLVKDQLKEEAKQFNEDYEEKVKMLLGEMDEKPQQTEITSEEVFMIDPAGNRRKVPKKQAKEAKKAGYKLA